MLFLTDPVTPTVSTVVSAVTTLFSEAVDWVGDVAGVIMDTPILLAFVALPLVGLGVGLFMRLINVN